MGTMLYPWVVDLETRCDLFPSCRAGCVCRSALYPLVIGQPPHQPHPTTILLPTPTPSLPRGLARAFQADQPARDSPRGRHPCHNRQVAVTGTHMPLMSRGSSRGKPESR